MIAKQARRNEIKRILVAACAEVMKEKGHGQTSIREVALRCGYTPAAIYRYFEKFDDLKLYASMQFLKKYIDALEASLEESKNALDKFLLIWDCFCRHAYENPEIYQYRFYLFTDQAGEDLVQQYYLDFPEEVKTNWSPSVREMLMRTQIDDRNMALIEELEAEGYIDRKDCHLLNQLNTILFEGVFSRVLRRQMAPDQARKFTMHSFAVVMNCHLKKKSASAVFKRYYEMKP